MSFDASLSPVQGIRDSVRGTLNEGSLPVRPANLLPLARRLIVVTGAVGLLLAMPAAMALAQHVDPNLWVTDGPVRAVAKNGNTLYIGGDFSYVGPYTGGGVPLSSSDGTALAGFPKVRGTVFAAQPDREGGWYIGGVFDSVGGQARQNLAHVRSDLMVDAWNPGANERVYALALFSPLEWQNLASGTTVDLFGVWGTSTLLYAVGAGGAIRRYNGSSWTAVTSGTTADLYGIWGVRTGGSIDMFSVGDGGAILHSTGSGWSSMASGTTAMLHAVHGTSATSVVAVGNLGTIRYYNGSVWSGLSSGTTQHLFGVWGSSSSNVFGVGAAGTILRYNGSSVIPMVSGTTERLNAIWGSSASDIFAVGAAGTILHFDGSSWSAMASGTTADLYGVWGTSASDVHVVGFSGVTLHFEAGIWSPIPAPAAPTLRSVWGRSSAEVFAVGGLGSVLALHSDPLVCAGGFFDFIGGQMRHRIAALNATTGLATAWNPDARSGVVHSLAVRGATVYVGGVFGVIGGEFRSDIAALDAATGLATDWNPTPNDAVDAVAVNGTTVYAGGSFHFIGGQTRVGIAALDATTGLATAWNPDAGGVISTLAVNGTTVYAGGLFDFIGGQARHSIAALDATTGLATAWNPGAYGVKHNTYGEVVFTLAVNGTTVYAGGSITSFGGKARNNIAALDATTGLATDWNPDAGDSVLALAVSGTTVYAGGAFRHMGWYGQHEYIAALDAATGRATDWYPYADGQVVALAVNGARVYAGGEFTHIGGGARHNIAALDATTGHATDWNPDADGHVGALVVNGTRVYAGGDFTWIGGQARAGIAALDATTGLATDWNPTANGGAVRALVVRGTTVYAGGNFDNIGGENRNNIAALDAATGHATDWNPNANGWVYTLAAGGAVYAGGDFDNIGREYRNNIAALNATTGLATDWNPDADSTVYALALSGTTVYTGGEFTQVGGVAAQYLAAIDDPSMVLAPVFTDIAAGLTGVSTSAAVWGDYDNDGDLDLALTGDTGVEVISRIYHNNRDGTFTDINAGLPGVYRSSVAWGDYDGDGDLDLLLSGGTNPGLATRVYRNDGGAFHDINAGLQGLWLGSVAWGDYDNDGDLDILLTGATGGGSAFSVVYRNDGGGVFSDIGAGLPGVRYSAAAWGDYDNDGDLDILLAGNTTEGAPIASIYRNDGGAFNDINAGLPGVRYASVAWGDYDNDGHLDFALMGWDGVNGYLRVYHNNGDGMFTDANAGLPGWDGGTVAWGDYDNDGDLDLLLSGERESSGTWLPRSCLVYRNDGGGSFAAIDQGLMAVVNGGAAWGDYDNDGDLDVLLTGDAGSESISRIYRSDGAPANTSPTAPTGLSAQVVGDHVTLSWTEATDAQTPAAGLSYNLRIGTTPGGNQVTAGMANASSGYRRVAQLGNAQERTSWTVKLQRQGIHYWSVQAVDGAFAGSPFAVERGFASTVEVPEGPPENMSFALVGANPAPGEASFRFGLPAKARVSLAIYDVSGRRVAELLDGELPAGYHAAVWDGRDAGAAPGVYFVRFAADRREITRRLVILQ